MLTENGVEIDYDALDKIFSEGDVIIIGFSFTADRLLIDCRFTESVGPLVTPVGPVESVQERYEWLRQHRPDFGEPEEFSFFVWPKTLRSLMELPNLGALLARLGESTAKPTDELRQALSLFSELELDSMRASIEGKEPWHTVWAVNETG